MEIPSYEIRKLLDGSAEEADYDFVRQWLDGGGARKMNDAADALAAANREIEQLHKDAEITRQLLIGAALDSIYESMLGADQSLPPLRELSEDIKEYWSNLTDIALQSGGLAPTDIGAIRRVHEQLSLGLPQYK